MTFKQNLKVIGLLVKLKLARTMAFRTSFFGGFFADAAFYLIQVLTVSVIYGQVDSIGGWSRGQMLICIGTYSMVSGIHMVTYLYGLQRIPLMIREGWLDQYLTKPGNTLLRLTFEEVNLGSLPLLPLSGGIIAWGVSIEGIHITPLLIIAYSIMVLLMTLLWYDMEILLRTIPFFVISANSIERLEVDVQALNARIPGILYKGFLKILFCFVLPYGIIGTVPTQLISGTLTLPGLVNSLCIIVAFTAFTLWFWRFGLKHYKSASS